jgi:hypothetical protein
LYQTDANLRWYQSAGELAKTMLAFFKDEQGGFFDTPADLDDLFTRPKDYQDNATPSGNALAAYALLLLAEFGGVEDYRSIAMEVLAALQDGFVKQPCFRHVAASRELPLGRSRGGGSNHLLSKINVETIHQVQTAPGCRPSASPSECLRCSPTVPLQETDLYLPGFVYKSPSPIPKHSNQLA